MSHIRKRGKTRDDTRYLAVYRGPDHRERTKTFRRQEDAKRFLKTIDARLAAGDWVDPARGRVTIAEWSAAWLSQVEALGKIRATTLARLRVSIRQQVLPAFGSRHLSTLTANDVQSWVVRMKGDGLSASTIRKAVFALRGMLKAAILDQRLSHNVTKDVELPPESHDRKEPSALTAAQVLKLADAVPGEHRALILLAGFCGLRWGELAGLRGKDVNCLQRRVRVEQTAIDIAGQPVTFGPPKTKQSRRTVAMPRSIVEDVQAYLTRHAVGQDDLVFRAAEGGALRRGTFARVWRRATTTAGVPGFRFHDLRHTFVSLLIRSGADVRQVASWAGHSSPIVTLNVYAHLFEGDEDAAADRMDALMSEAVPEPVPIKAAKA